MAEQMRLEPIDIKTCVEVLLQSLKPEESKIEKIILFGSAARGDVRGLSDLDVVIIEETNEPFLRRLERYYQQIRIPCGLDLLVYTNEEFERMKTRGNPFIRRVISEGKTLYEKKSKR